MKEEKPPIWRIDKPRYLEPTDKRYKAHLRQIKKYGFSDSETWGLDCTIAAFVLPRLRRYKKVANGYPAHLPSFKAWIDILNKIEYSLASVLEDDFLNKNDAEYLEGMQLFAEYFSHLWW